MSALLIHKRNAIVLLFTDREGSASIPLPPEAFSDMDVTSEEAYLASVGKVLGKKVSPSVPAVLVIADELCYAAQAKPAEVVEKTRELISNTPFTHVETTTIKTPNMTYIIATNADIYETAARVFDAYGYAITAVVPWAALAFHKISSGGEVDRVTVKRTFDALGTLKSYAFPLSAHERAEPAAAPEAAAGKQKSLPVGWILFGGLALLYAVGMIWYMTRQ